MKMKNLGTLLFLCSIIFFTGCVKKNNQFQKDMAEIGDVMCKTMEVVNQLKAVPANDTTVIRELTAKESKVEQEMKIIYEEFRNKYSKKMNDTSFIKEFRSELKKNMLKCKYLSKEDREMYEKESN